jgi:hypothetical protein
MHCEKVTDGSRNQPHSISIKNISTYGERKQDQRLKNGYSSVMDLRAVLDAILC